MWSPEHECGKGRVLDVTEKLVRRPFRTSNTSAAVLYHVISKGNLSVLVDELDSVSDEQRAAICNTDRQEDVWEPLIAIARVAGGDWEPRIRFAAQKLASGGSDGASETVAHQLLAALQSYFSEHGDRADTKTIIAVLNESGDFADVNFGRGLTRTLSQSS